MTIWETTVNRLAYPIRPVPVTYLADPHPTRGYGSGTGKSAGTGIPAGPYCTATEIQQAWVQLEPNILAYEIELVKRCTSSSDAWRCRVFPTQWHWTTGARYSDRHGAVTDRRTTRCYVGATRTVVVAECSLLLVSTYALQAVQNAAVYVLWLPAV